MHIERVNCPKLMMGQMQANLLTTGDAPVVEPPRVTPLPAHENPDITRLLEEKGWKSLMDTQHAQHFAQHCCLCNRWVRDPTAVKRHLSKAHVEQWKQVASRLETRCAEIKHLLDRDGVTRVSYSRHYKQCNIVLRAVRPAPRRWRRRLRRCSEIGCRLCRLSRTGQRRSPENRDRTRGSRANGPDRPEEAREATAKGFNPTISTTLSQSWRLSPFNRVLGTRCKDSIITKFNSVRKM